MLPTPIHTKPSLPSLVLVVEDQPIALMLLAEELRDAGMNVLEATNADEAWAQLQAHKDVDLIFSDITMPGSMDGLELMRRARREFPAAKRLLTSAMEKPEHLAGLATFLPKPFRLKQAKQAALDMLDSRA